VGQGTRVEVKLPGADGRSPPAPAPPREQFRTRQTDCVDTGAS
jgi:hypothetical protein